jgi:hypothetical protein
MVVRRTRQAAGGPPIQERRKNHFKKADNETMKTKFLLFALGGSLALTGCQSIGPGTIVRDRFDYGDVLGESWKSQMLLNLVKIRYGDSPVFLDVGSIVAGYSSQRSYSASASANGVSHGFPEGTTYGTAGIGVAGSFNDSPTITYSPLQGAKFARSLMTPIPTTALMNVIQTGFPVDQVLRLTAQSINGLDNRRSLDLGVQPANPEFYALLRELRRIQNSGDIGMRVDNVGGGDVVLQMVLRPKSAAAVENARLNVTKFLGLNPAAREFSVVYGAVQRTNSEIAILSRSIYQVLADLSWSIAVPDSDVEKHLVTPTPADDLSPGGTIPPLIQINESTDRPKDAFVAIPYRGHWFFVSDADMPSKRTFSFILFLFTFVETDTKDSTPILTIPTTR